jgi:hypothetical protein
LILAALAVWYFKRRKQLRVRRAAFKELENLRQAYLTHYDKKRFVKDLSVLLRRISVSYFPSREVAGLTGAQWLEFLDSTLSPKRNKSGHKFSGAVGEALIHIPYSRERHDKNIDVDTLYTLSEEWIRSLGPVRARNVDSGAQARAADGDTAHASV